MEGSRDLTCADCGARFEFSAVEQQQFQARGFAPPKRCRECRAAKRRRVADRQGEQRGEPRGAAPRGNGPQIAPLATPRPRPPQELHPATCTVCGAATEVPFRPDGVRPVYCLPCLKQRTR